MSAALRQRLQSLRVRGVLSDLDAHFAALLLDLHPGGDSPLALAAALASRAAGEGHACMDLAAAAARSHFDDAWHAPPLDAWCDALAASGAAGPGEARRPLVIDGARLYLHRYWRYETEIAANLRARVARNPAVDEARLAAGLDRLFGPADPHELQRIAAERAVRNAVMVISGGPGTGKTTTVARVLALLLEQSPDRPLAVGLAAPTGKAAARLQASLDVARDSLGLSAPLRAALPRTAQTLHRLIGAGGAGGGVRHDAERPLPLDVLVVDEASMVDLAMAARVVRALPPTARLILLGDRDQLASVEPGSVFAALCAGLPAGNVVMLERSHRFPEGSGIGRLARAVRAGDAEAAIAVLESAPPELSWDEAPDPQRAVDLAMAGFEPLFEAVDAGADPARCFAALDRFRVLCASRIGPLGAHAVNRGVITRLQSQGRVPRQLRTPAAGRGGHFVGQPLMVTRNDYGLRLFNGDVGVVVPDAPDGLSVAFPAEGGGHRTVALARLPDCETVYAMTVHKSQGSEFDAALVLPAAERAGLVTRELVYTAVTRVRRHAAILCGREALAEAIRARAERDSGLEDRLSAA